MKVKLIIRTLRKLVAQLIVSHEKDIENIEIYYKQSLKKLHEIDQISKILSNKTDKS